MIRLQGSTELADEGASKLFFELNGQPRAIRIEHTGSSSKVEHPKANEGDPKQVGAPMPGMVVRIAVQLGQSVAKGEPLLALEAMKMETVIAAPADGRIKAIHVKSGTVVAARDLLITLE